MKIYVYFIINDWDIIRQIQRRFGLPDCITVNGETCQPCNIKEQDMELLKETEKRGFIQIRKKDE